jgi:arylsulfatase A-like enzyme
MTRQDLSDYYNLVKWLDDGVGECMDILEEAGVADNTVVCFLSDHGVAFPRAKSTLYDTGMKTPLIIRWPGKLKAGSTYSGLVSEIDILPTLLTVAGIPVSEKIEGQLIPFLVETNTPQREVIYAEKTWHDDYDPMRCIRTERYKYIRNFKPGPLLVMPSDFSNSLTAQSMHESYMAPRPDEELYDLQQDPYELTNRALDPAHDSTLRHMRERLKDWQKKTLDPVAEQTAAEMAATS